MQKKKMRNRTVKSLDAEKNAASFNGGKESRPSWIIRANSKDFLFDALEGSDEFDGFDEFEESPVEFSAALRLKLDTLDELLSNANVWRVSALLGVIFGIIGIHLGWFDAVLGEKAVFVKSIWLYLAIFTTAAFVTGRIAVRRKIAIYRQYRDGLHREMDRDGIDIASLYEVMRGDHDLINVAQCIRGDIRYLEDAKSRH